MKKTIFTRRNVTGFVAVTVLLLVMGVMLYLAKINDYKKAVDQITFQEVDVTKVPDGRYIGEYDVNVIYAKVEVVVKEGKIDSIFLLEHKNERGSRAERIIKDIVREQRIQVDAVSGATNSSKVIKKAVENALNNHG